MTADIDQRLPIVQNGKGMKIIATKLKELMESAEAAFENFLLDQAEELYNKIIDDITNKSVNVVINETESSSQMLPVPNLLPAPSTDEIFYSYRCIHK